MGEAGSMCRSMSGREIWVKWGPMPKRSSWKWAIRISRPWSWATGNRITRIWVTDWKLSINKKLRGQGPAWGGRSPIGLRRGKKKQINKGLKKTSCRYSRGPSISRLYHLITKTNLKVHGKNPNTRSALSSPPPMLMASRFSRLLPALRPSGLILEHSRKWPNSWRPNPKNTMSIQSKCPSLLRTWKEFLKLPRPWLSEMEIHYRFRHRRKQKW